MHREILNVEKDVDHRDLDGLNNQRHNLRASTKAQNQANSPKRVFGATSRFRGVSLRSDKKKWVAQIEIAGKQTYLGSFLTEELAAAAYDTKRAELHGEHAHLNLCHTT